MFSFSSHTRLSFSAETPPLLSASNYEQINSTTLSYSKGGYHTGADTKTINIIQPWIPLTNWLRIHLLLFIPTFQKNSSNYLNNKYIHTNVSYHYFVVLDKSTRKKQRQKTNLPFMFFWHLRILKIAYYNNGRTHTKIKDKAVRFVIFTHIKTQRTLQKVHPKHQIIKPSIFTYGITGIQDKFTTHQIVHKLLFAGNLQTRVFSFLNSRCQ